MINFAWKIRYPAQKLKHYSYLFQMDKKCFEIYLFKVKNKQIKNSFIQKTYKKGFRQFIFTVWVLGEKIELLVRNFPWRLRKIRPSELSAVSSR